MDVTVIICTYNRANCLPAALESVVASALSVPLGWELLVIDNNSSDNTREVVGQFRNKYLTRLRYVFEPQQGLAHARNTGVQEARGDIVVFTDDDVVVQPSWLQNVAAGLLDSSAAGVGGRVLPRWGCAIPKWLTIEQKSPLLGTLAMFDKGPNAERLTEPPFGANMAFRKGMFNKHGLFRTDLGRCGDHLLSGEDTEFGWRLLNVGECLRYEPSAVVYHPIDEERLNKDYFLRWWLAKGRSDVRESGVENSIKCLGVPLSLIRDATLSTVRWSLTFDTAARFYRKAMLWANAGQILECYAQRTRSSVLREWL